MITPTFSVDFTAASFDPRISFSRSGATATRINASGFVETVSADTPRFDFNPVSLACAGLLVEESRTNSLLQSQNFGVSWLTEFASVSTDQITAPDGLLTGDKILANTTNNQHYVYQIFAYTAGVSYTLSVFAKKGEYNFLRLAYPSAAFGTGTSAFFDLNNGTVGTVYNNPSPQITPFGDGWYRCSISKTATASSNNRVILAMAPTDNVFDFVGATTSGVYLWGGQFETGSFPTSYIPTTTAALTRNADDALITGTAFSGLWRSGPGSILARALPSTVSGTRPLVQVDDATADNIIALRGNTTNPELYIRAGGADQATIDAGTISAAAYRLAGSWKAGNGVATLNGFAPVKGTPASIPAATQMRLGSDGTNYLNGHLQSLEYWDEFLTPATLQSVTTSAGYRSIVGPVMRDTIIA